MAYDAFISYSHEGDNGLAAQLRAGMERMAKRWTSRRALRVFLDESGLSATPSLWGTITAALDECRYLVLLASPAAAASEWVGKEVEYFVARHGADHVIVVLEDGSCDWDDDTGSFAADTSAIPAALRAVLHEEPLWVDLTWARDSGALDLHHPRFREVVAAIAAPIHGVPLDELDATDLREHRRQRRARAVAMTAMAVLAIGATAAGVVAVSNARRADDNAATAEKNAATAEANAETARENEAEALAAGQRADARRLAAQAELLAAEQTDVATLLALESLVREPAAAEGRSSLATVMTEPIAVSTFGTADDVTALAAHDDMLVFGHQSGMVTVRTSPEAADRQLASTVAGASTLALSGDGRTLAIRGPEEVAMVTLRDGGDTPLSAFRVAADPCLLNATAIDLAGDRVAAAGGRGLEVRATGPASVASAVAIDLGLAPSEFCDLSQLVWDVALTDDGSFVAAAYGFGPTRIGVWSTAEGAQVASFEDVDVVRAVTFSADGAHVLSGGEGGVVRRWDVAAQP